MKNAKWISLAVLAAFFISCSTTKTTTGSNDHSTGQPQPDDTLSSGDFTVAPDTFPFRPARERKWDLQHTALDLSFDWQNQNVIGSATLKCKPVFYPQQILALDADHFRIQSVSLFGKPYNDYKNDSAQIIIHLPRPFKQDEEVTVTINYIAHPQPSAGNEGTAITNDQGLFFIDPLDTTPDLPRQIWTQGETSSNRKWYPTLDQPNERGTQEITLTVPDSLMTLSNGLLISSTPAENGMRKDYWKLDLPHAPYLAMIAVGKWDKVTDYWRGRPVEYYVDPGYGEDARYIYANTPEMIEFFSRKLDFPYVWPKYSQVVVKYFVTGAMENTTATVHADYIQFHREDMMSDGQNDYVVAHELFHHWFGDLVTCESWANITLNEGFANYAEYLWNEYKYGREKADISRMSELSGYFDEAEREVHPLINYHYANEVAIFDAHAYNKGGLVLHMLRDLVGDEAFFASLHNYLQEHQFSSVEVTDLRQAFEKTTGRDLQWFFDQWYLGKGHPELNIHHTYDSGSKKVNITFTQIQDEKGYTPVFQLPVEINIYKQDSTAITEHVWLDQKENTFSFDVPNQPLAVIVDPRDILLAVVHHDVSEKEYPVRGLLAPSISHRVSALTLMTDMDDAYLRRIMVDSSWAVRGMAIQYMTDHNKADYLFQSGMRERDPDLQFFILESLAASDQQKAKEVAIHMLKSASRIPLLYLALKTIQNADPAEAVRQLELVKGVDANPIYAVRASILANSGSGLDLDYFKTPQAAVMNDPYLEEMITALTYYLSNQSPAIQQEGLELINSGFYLHAPSPEYRILSLISALYAQYDKEKDGPYKTYLLAAMKGLYARETDDYLKGIIKEGLGNLLD